MQDGSASVGTHRHVTELLKKSLVGRATLADVRFQKNKLYLNGKT
jgi:hypothetical protein